MKKLVFVLTGLVVAVVINAQSLEEIVKNHSVAIKSDSLANTTSVKVTSKATIAGMEIPIVIYSKNPDKVRSIVSYNGQDILSVYDGEKGYMINPLSGSLNPVELTGEQLKKVQDDSVFLDEILNYFNMGQLTLERDGTVNGKSAFVLKAKLNRTPNFRFISKESYLKGSPVFFFIDKESFLLVKASTKIHKKGSPIPMNYDLYMTDFVDIDNVVMAKKTTIEAGGMETGVILIDKIEVNIPMDDSIFKIK
jgi:hypothetical protein